LPKITYIEANGKEHVVVAPVGHSVMEAAVKLSVPGIDAECGGAMVCATCHVYVDRAWRNAIPEPSDEERSMLEFAHEVGEGSRLSCQIAVTAALDGLIVRMPESQR
jgi:2Fe-2S ferredoxin